MAYKILIERQDPITQKLTVAEAADERGRDLKSLIRYEVAAGKQEPVWPNKRG